jgi:hypothetical protein
MSVREYKGISNGRPYTCQYSKRYCEYLGCYTFKIVHGTIKWGDDEKSLHK